ncbi:beta-lactamase/transpeptidase-like protein [Mycena vulgaris]|nr:beta-lactamase/transpeptidase-like protein [Mycena vulgaris]
MHLSRALLLAPSFCGLAAAAVPAGLGLQQPFYLSDSEDAPVLNAKLDAAILDILKQFKTAGGVGVVVVRKTPQGTWKLESKGYGNATIDGGKVTADTLFAIGSNSKLFNVLATGLLISNETLSPRISWTSKMASILPGWKLMDPVATSESTIHDLMSHRTGLPSHDFMAPLDASISHLQYLRPSTGFREQLQYDNHMYTVLSHLPQVLLNTTYEAYVRNNMFLPLGINTTTYFYANAVKTGRLANGFVRENANFTEDPFHQGTTRPLPFWDRSEKGHGESLCARRSSLRILLSRRPGSRCYSKSQSNETVIPAAVIQKVARGLMVWKAVAPYPELSPVVYGGGQRRGTYRGFELIEHGGSVPCFRSQITHFPGQNLGIAVLSKDEELGSPMVESVKFRIIDAVLQLEPIDWPARYSRTTPVTVTQLTQAVPPLPVPRADNAAPPSVAYAALAGTYTHPAAQTLPGVLEPRVPTLLARWETLMTNYAQLAHYAGNTFNLTGLYSSATETGEVWVNKIPGFAAEFETNGEGDVGFAMVGIWGLGDDVPPPEGNTVQERAEVWFTKS